MGNSDMGGMAMKMRTRTVPNRLGTASIVAVVLVAFGAGGVSADPKVVSGPGVMPECFKPFSSATKFMQYPKKEGPLRIALANGFVGNIWRIQMVKSAKAYVEQPDVKPDVKELKVVSTGNDVAAQIGAIDQFINSGYDAVVTIAVNPTAFGPVIKRANKANVVLVPFDNVLDTEEVIQVNEDQREIGRLAGRYLVSHIPSHSGRILEVRGIPGNSVDRDRHNGFREAMNAGGKWEFVEIVGNWEEGTTHKLAADAIAVHQHFDGGYVQDGTPGLVRALMDSHHPFIPVAGQAENGFRKLCATHAAEGLKCASVGQTPGLVAIAIKTAISAARGNVMPQFVSVPIPYSDSESLKAGVNYFPDLPDNFYTNNEFPPCNVNVKATDIMGKSEANQ
jgi:ribose transport system substrate-binding protein